MQKSYDHHEMWWSFSYIYTNMRKNLCMHHYALLYHFFSFVNSSFLWLENAVVLLSYPEKVFGNPKALLAFLSTDVSLTTNEILSCYVCRCPIEVFLRQRKNKLALESYQIRSAKGIQRYWLLMSLAHYICVMGTGKSCSFENGYHQICDIIQQEKYRYLFQFAKASNNFESFMKLAV